MFFRSTVLRKGPGLVALLALGALLAPAAAQAQGCEDTHLRPTRANLEQVRGAVLCLHNQERARHGLPQLRENPASAGPPAATRPTWSASASSITPRPAA